ncbi:hypothetical protein AB6A40_010820, partial [Gnathostoma spinigerum]
GGGRGGYGGGRGRGGGGGGGGRGGGGRGGGRGGFRGGHGGHGYDQGPPDEVIELGYFTHTCEDDIVCNTTVGKIPYFNAPVYFENKENVGRVDEIFGGPRDNGFSVKLAEGIKASSFREGMKLYIDPSKLLPVERFLNPNSGRGRGGRGGSRGGGFRGTPGGGRGNFRGGRSSGTPRGGRGGRNSYGGSGGRGRGGGQRGGGFQQKRFSSNFGASPSNKKIRFS